MDSLTVNNAATFQAIGPTLAQVSATFVFLGWPSSPVLSSLELEVQNLTVTTTASVSFSLVTVGNLLAMNTEDQGSIILEQANITLEMVVKDLDFVLMVL